VNTVIGNRALVLGGSLAGLLAARVLADAYGEVTVVERDELPDATTPRRGIPQGRHVHGLLARGQLALEELLPGLTAELVAHGAPTLDMLGDSRLSFGGHRFRQAETGLVVLCVSRPFLEGHVRARVRALPNVTLFDRCDIVGLTATANHRRVTGARVLRRADNSAEEVLEADLVIDATGRGSRAPLWLEGLGYLHPQREQVRIDLGYATRTYHLPTEALGTDSAALQGPTPDHPRAGLLQVIEGGRSILTLAGMLREWPPTDPDDFLAFARSLQFPDIYDAIRDAEPLDDPVPFRYPANVRYHYQRLTRLPTGLLVTGDAVCHTNPLYGQGMTMAALHALTLREHLATTSEPDPRRFFRDVARVVEVPWQLAVGADLAFPEVQGRRTARQRMLGRYVMRLQAAAAHDATVAEAFLRVISLMDRPEALLRPSVTMRLLKRTQHVLAPASTEPHRKGVP
jgi:2-polyprenyl-6-methoxyphenol hydroxylase-like FAD-dependent oxidoreductase